MSASDIKNIMRMYLSNLVSNNVHIPIQLHHILNLLKGIILSTSFKHVV